ncbi:HAMP domain-containing sensor histidine kinase [uncultured Clostridium sp.]|uniref:HAMP domain-containing sensor histidine kinase n=1 Tax=uncultured Clostridium sp. TaxID=59620 RepID=UPI00262D6270|nr:HAMP domain-containing sensor histidine kinase [uncultured Clostridium sp.]
MFNKRKKRDKLVVSVFKRYISFVIILGIICGVTYLYIALQLPKVIEKNSVPLFDIVSGEYIDYTTINTNELKELNGEMEIINKEGVVVRRYGKIPHESKEYTQEQLLELATKKEDGNYDILMNAVKDKDNQEYYCLLRIPKDKLKLSLNLFKVPFSIGKPFYKEYAKVIIIAAGFSILCIILYSVYTAKKLKKPLTEIDNALISIINGNYNEKIHFKGEEEFEGIRDTLNYLIDKLNTSEEENRRLEKSKNQMLLDLSHDIKTPMTTIKSYSAALSEGMLESEEEREQYYRAIYKKSERVSELIEELFEFVKLDNKSFKFNYLNVDICEVLRTAIVDYYEELEHIGIELHVSIPEESVVMPIDIKLFKRAISNIIENSMKYNEIGKNMWISLECEERFVTIIIKDDGVGIPQNIKTNLFDEFVRGDESRQTNGGTGLGLSITKKIIENHSGRINLIESKKGATFKIKLRK